MSATIDQRIVDMQFNNGEFEKGIQTSIKSLDELKKALKLENAEKGIEQLEKTANTFSMSGMEKSVQNIEDRFSMLGIVGMRVIERLTDRVADFAERTVKSLSVDQVTAGWEKYNDKTKAVQQIIAATGKDIEEVDAQLEKLNWFTDETSYSFVDMVNNIGKFTSVGVDLEDAVTAMQGISTWAALSGGGINEASRAMYNLSQAMGLGAVKMMDWKSITLANMATKEFKETVIETAKAIGVLDKNSRYKGKQISFENFESTLQYGWFNKDVLLETLKRYGEGADAVKAFIDEYKEATGTEISASEAMEMMGANLDDLGMKAFIASQEAKTFKEAVDSVKDAVSTQWMSIFHHIFGNYEEAKVIWTDLANYLFEIFVPGIAGVNDAFEQWHIGEGKGLDWADALNAVYDILATIKDIIDVIRESFHTMVPGFSVETLQNFTAHLISFADAFRSYFGIVERVLEKIDRGDKTFKGVVEGFDQTLEEGARGDDVKRLQETLVDAGFGEELGKAYVDGIFGPKTKTALKKAQKAMGIKPTGIFDEETRMAFAEFFAPEEVEETISEYSTGLDQLARIFQGIGSAINFVWNILTLIFRVGGYVLSLFAPIGRVFMEVLAVAGDFLTLITGGLSQETIFARIQTSLAPLAGMIEGAAAWLSTFFATGEDKQEGMLNFWDALNGIITPVKEAFEQIGSVWEKVAAYFSPGSNRNIKKTNRSLQKNGKTFRMVAEDTEDAGEGFLFLEKIFNRISSAFDSVKTSLSTVWNELVALWNSIWGSISSAFSDEGDAANKATGFLGGVLEVIGTILVSGLFVLAWAAEKIGVVISSIRHWLFGNEETGESGFISKVKKYFEDLDNEFHISDSVRAFWTDTVEPWLQGIKDFLFGTKNEETGQREGGLAYRISSWFTELKESLEGNEQLQAAWRNVKNWLAHVKNTLFGSDMAVNSEEAAENQMDIPIVHNEGLLDRIRKWFGDLKKTLEENEIVQDLWTWWTDFLQSVKDVLFGTKNEETGQREGGAIYNIVEWFKNLYNYLKDSDTLKTLWEGTKEVIAAIWDWLFGTNNEETGQREGGLADRIGGFFSGLIDTFSNVHSLDEAFQAAKLVIQDIKNWFRSLFGLDPVYDSSIGTVNGGHYGLNESGSGLGNINSGLKSLSDSFSEAETKTNTISGITERIKTKWEEIKTNLGEAFGNIGINFENLSEEFEKIKPHIRSLITLLEIIGLVYVIYKFMKVWSDISNSQAAKSIGKWNSHSDKTQKLLNAMISLGILAAAIFALGTMKPEELKRGFIVATILVGAIVGLYVLFGYLDKKNKISATGPNGDVISWLKNLAIAVGIMAAVIWAMGKIDDDTLKRGSAITAGIVTVLILVALALQGISSIHSRGDVGIKGLKDIAIAVGILAVIVWAMGTFMNHEQYRDGMLRMISLVGLLLIVALALQGISTIQVSGNSGIKGLKEIAIAIGILAVIVWAVGSLIDDATYWSGFKKVAILMAALLGCVALMKKIAKTGTIKVSGLIGVAAAIGILAAIVYILGGIPRDQFMQGMSGLVGIVAALGILVTIFGYMSSNNMNIDMSKFWQLIIGMMVAILAFAFALNKIKDIDPWKIAAFAGGLSVALIALAAAAKIASETNAGGSAVGGAASITAAFAAVVVIIGALMTGLGDISNIHTFGGLPVPDAIEQGGELLKTIGKALATPEAGLLAAITAAGVIFGLCFRNEPKAMLWAMAGDAAVSAMFGGTVVIVGAVLAGLGDLSTINTFGGLSVPDAIEQGGELIRKIGNALSSNQTAFLIGITGVGAIFGLAVSHQPQALLWALLGEVAIGALFGATAAIATYVLAKIGELGETVNDSTGDTYKEKVEKGGTLLETIGKSLAGFGHGYRTVVITDIQSFANAVSEARDAIDGMSLPKEGDTGGISDLEAAIAFVNRLHTYFSELTPYSFIDIAIDKVHLIGYVTAASQLSTDVKAFGIAINTLGQGLVKLSGVPDVESGTTTAIGCAEQIHKFFTDLQPYTVYPDMMKGYYTAPDQLSTDMTSFAQAIYNFATAIDGFESKPVEEQAAVAIRTATQVKTFFDDIALTTPDDKNLKTYTDKLEATFGSIDRFSMTMAGFNSRLGGVDPIMTWLRTASVLSAVRKAAEFLHDLGAEDLAIEGDKHWWDRFINGDTNVNKLFAKIGELGQLVANTGSYFGENSTKTFSDGVGRALTTSRTMLAFMLEMQALDEEGKSLQSVGVGLSTSFDHLMEGLWTFGQKISSFNEATITVDADRFKTITDGIWNMARAVVGISSIYVPNSLDTINNFIENFDALFSKDVWENIDVSGASSIYESIYNQLETEKSIYYDKFKEIGAYLAQGLADGISSGESGVINAVVDLCTKAIVAATTTFDESSPSKVFNGIGRYLDEGLANGIDDSASVPENAMTMLAQSLISDMDGDPVIRPIVDMSEVERSAGRIGGLINQRGSVSIDASMSRRQAGSIGRSAGRNQNGSVMNTYTTNDDSVAVSGNTFIIRSDQDVRDLASELASLTKRQNRSMGAMA